MGSNVTKGANIKYDYAKNVLLRLSEGKKVDDLEFAVLCSFLVDFINKHNNGNLDISIIEDIGQLIDNYSQQHDMFEWEGFDEFKYYKNLMESTSQG